jgi:hypothetical protein
MRRLGPKSRSSTRTRSCWASSKTGRRRSSCATTSSRGPSWKTMGCVRASCLMAAHPPADPRSRQHAAQALREELAGSLPSPAGVCSEHRWRRGHGRGEQARHHWSSGELHRWALTACIAGREGLQQNVEVLRGRWLERNDQLRGQATCTSIQRPSRERSSLDVAAEATPSSMLLAACLVPTSCPYHGSATTSLLRPSTESVLVALFSSLTLPEVDSPTSLCLDRRCIRADSTWCHDGRPRPSQLFHWTDILPVV